MKQGKGKNKGSAFERLAAGLLDVWWKVPKNTFWRTVNSGGWKQPGDLAPRILPEGGMPWFPFVVECKFYRTIDFWDIIKQNKSAKLKLWWQQLTMEKYQCKDPERTMRMLIFKQNNSPICVGFSQGEILNFMKVDAKIHVPTTYIKLFFDGCAKGKGNPADYFSMAIMTWEDFTKLYPKDVFNNAIGGIII